MEYQRMMLKMNMERLRERSMTNHLLNNIVKDYEAYEEKLKEQDLEHQLRHINATSLQVFQRQKNIRVK